MAKPVKKKNKGDEAQAEMTPMIDVVFQLLIFFIVTLKQDDILSNLDALRPAPDSSMSKPDPNEPLSIQIGRVVGANGRIEPIFIWNGHSIRESQLEANLKKLAKVDKTQMVLIKCAGDSPHGGLVRALDLVSKAGLTQVSVFSM